MQERRAGVLGTGRHVPAIGVASDGLLLQLKEQLVLDDVHAHGNTTRPEIAARLGLSAATVSRAVRRLVEQGLVHEGPGVSTGGRRRATITFNPRSGCVVGVDLGGTKCHAVLADLSGAAIAEETRPADADGAPFDTLVASIERLMRRPERAGAPLEGVAVGVPAIVDEETGVATGGPNVHWDGFPVVSRLAVALDAPFVVDNDVNFAALGHAWKGAARGRADFVVLSLGTGIGGAIVSGGRLLRGGRSAAGEVGYLALTREELRTPRPGGMGAFEVQASGVGLAALAARALRETEVPSSLRGIGRPPDPRDVIAAAAAGDALAGSIIASAVDHVAMAVIAMSAACDPTMVILDGSVGLALGRWVPEIAALAARHLPDPPEVILSTLGGEATVMGAIAAALDLSRTRRAPLRASAPSAVPLHVSSVPAGLPSIVR
jgi:glucokinase